MLIHFTLQALPTILNSIEIRRAGWLFQDLNIIFLKSSHQISCSMDFHIILVKEGFTKCILHFLLNIKQLTF